MTTNSSPLRDLTPSLAATELLRRRSARGRLIPFTEYTNPQYASAAHHRLIAEKLEAVERGEIKRLMIFMPPRHGKSELASRRFPAWYLGRRPDRQIIAASYNSDLANDFGREVRNIVSAPEYRALFPVSLAADSQAANRWHTENGGMYVAAGVGTAITGRGAHVLLIDDPVKDREEADSETQRQKVWNWYTSTAYTRLMPDGAVILIQTRWHEDDLAGRLLEAQAAGGDQWDVLELPAILEGGEALWPDWYPLERLEQIRNAIGPRDWSALYQQRPAPDEGDFFKRDWFRWYEERPKHLRIYGASDFAVTADDGDYTVHIVAGVDPEDNLYILDLWRNRTASDIWIETMLDLAAVWKPISWAAEKGQIDRAVGPFLSKRMNERKVYVALEKFPTVTDKPTRAQSIRARAAQGKVYLPRNALWVADLLTEMLTFPAGKHDDQVDAMAWMGRMLATMASAHVPPGQEKPRPRDYGFGRQSEEADWRTV